MSDCTGYGFNQQTNLCLSGPVGNGNVADLTVQIVDVHTGVYSQNFDQSKSVVVTGWDGSDIAIDVTSLLWQSGSYSFVGAPCVLKAKLTLTATGQNNNTTSGTMLLQFIFTNCEQSGDGYTGYAKVYEECGGVGPHVVSEMSTFTIEGAACPA